jgi:hypothetical protein
MTSAITGAGALTTAVYTVYATATTRSDSSGRNLDWSLLSAESSSSPLARLLQGLEGSGSPETAPGEEYDRRDG